jgi:hypothetical protein
MKYFPSITQRVCSATIYLGDWLKKKQKVTASAVVKIAMLPHHAW